MKIAVFSTKSYDREFLELRNDSHELVFFETRLNPDTMSLAAGFPAICVFVNDSLSADVIEYLAERGLKVIALRCAGFNNVDLNAAKEAGIQVVRVPAYSPHAVAEHAVALVLELNRKLHRAYSRVREGNFALDGLLGFDLHGKTVGIVGTGKIGAVMARIMRGFGCQLLAYDVQENPDCTAAGATYVDLDALYQQADIISLHCPLVPDTHHLIDAQAIQKMKRGVMVINTSRGAIIDTQAVTSGLKSGQIGALGIDVYEEEADLFFEDLSGLVIQDDIFARLLTFPNVVVTGHQAFFTREALTQIAQTTLANITAVERGVPCENKL